MIHYYFIIVDYIVNQVAFSLDALIIVIYCIM